MTAPQMGHQQTFSIGGTSMMGWITVGKRAVHLERDGMRGTRSHDVDDVATGPHTVDGQIIINPTNTELVALDLLAIGAGGTVDETLTEFAIIKENGSNTYTYSNCVCDRFTLRGSQGGLWEVTMDVVGRTETEAGSAPAEPASALPLAYSGGTALVLQGSAREVESVEMVIDNAVIKDRFQHSITVTDTPTADRTVTLRTTHSLSTNTNDLYDQALAGAVGTLAVTDGTSTRTYTFGKLQVPAEPKEVRGKGPLPLNLNMVARKDGATKEIAAASS